MNKLVIVGNGFDLAHGLPTSYRHFIDSFWKNLKFSYEKEETKRAVYVNPNYFNLLNNPVQEYSDFKQNLINYSKEYGYRYEENNGECYTDNSRFHPIFKFENSFFKEINSKNTLENWVDIENVYYHKLKTILKIDSLDGQAKKKQVLKLNREFENIKILFANYLRVNVNDEFDLLNGRIIHFDHLLRHLEVKPKFLSATNDAKDHLLEYLYQDRNEIIEFDDLLVDAHKDRQLNELVKSCGKQTLFLNFNYTNTLYKYIDIMNNGSYGDHFMASEIPIHGKINNMNFGFGDEMDEDYKLIENLNDNEYLKNFKSFKYSQNSNYRKLLDYIDSDKFQVYVKGHSCGLSDRTLLNTIFEHQNCRSIKIFYHRREDGSDNFTEIIQNVSRHFNDKKMMRAKVVNKSLCEPLPQSIRFKRKDS